MTDEGFNVFSSFMKMKNMIPKKLSLKKTEIINNCKVIKSLFDKFQSKRRISENFFDELDIPRDHDVKGDIKEELRNSPYMSRQRC